MELIFDLEYYKKLDEILVLMAKTGATEGAIAGGAIRDSLLGKPINDLDIFYKSDEPLKIEGLFEVDTEEQICQEELNLFYKNLGKDSGWQVTHPYLKCSILPYKIQLIKVTKGEIDTHVHNTFGCNLSKVVYGSHLGVTLSKEFLHDFQYELLTFKEDCTEGYKEKMIKKYPEFMAISTGTSSYVDDF